MEYEIENINQNIKKLREISGLTQQQLGDKLGKRRDAIYRMEKNDTTISLQDAIKLSEIFKVSLDKLVNGDIDTSEAMKERKLELDKYIEGVSPIIDKKFNNLFRNLNNSCKGMAQNICKEINDITRDQIKKEIYEEVRDDLIEKLKSSKEEFFIIDDIEKIL